MMGMGARSHAAELDVALFVGGLRASWWRPAAACAKASSPRTTDWLAPLGPVRVRAARWTGRCCRPEPGAIHVLYLVLNKSRACC